ncbi:Phosphatidylinositol 3,5-bisphosphate-binding protein [Arthroderma sp. PD_2]|nr:Phosphatidylinositol 3,5-bisphosphate-binding protein [Arthroderma sp. PD_2]
MNTRETLDASGGPVSLTASFNRNSSCFSVGLDSGFCVFNADPCELKVSRDFNAGVGIVEMVGQSNYLALVGGGQTPKFPQNKVVVWDDAKQVAAMTLEFRTSILRVCITKSRIAVALYDCVHLYAFSVPPEKISVHETGDNPHGLVCLGETHIAVPGRSPGQVQLIQLATGSVSILPAHTSPLSAMTFSGDGAVLATASQTGTIIRVFATSNGAKMAELRRGLDQAEIFSLAISPSNTLLAVTSDKATLHIFDIPHARNDQNSSDPPTTSPEEPANRGWGLLGKLPFLPRVFSDVYSFASARFDIGDEPVGSHYVPPPGAPSERPSKGIIGWTSDQSLLVIGAGKAGRWERFVLQEASDGTRQCLRAGWKRYLGS